MNKTQTLIALNAAFNAIYDQLSVRSRELQNVVYNDMMAGRETPESVSNEATEISAILAHFWNVTPSLNAEDVE